MAGALTQLGDALLHLRAVARNHLGSSEWGDKGMRVDISFENQHQMFSFEQAIKREMDPWMTPKELGLGHGGRYDCSVQLMGIPIRLQVRRDRLAVLRDLEHAEEFLRRVKSSI